MSDNSGAVRNSVKIKILMAQALNLDLALISNVLVWFFEVLRSAAVTIRKQQVVGSIPTTGSIFSY